MREIKFRAFSSKTNEMIAPVSIANNTATEINGDILMQFTGLLDKDGREIYEGDLIRTSGFSDGYSEPVAWRGFGFQVGNYGMSPLYPRTDYEVIGNIYENPELVKEE